MTPISDLATWALAAGTLAACLAVPLWIRARRRVAVLSAQTASALADRDAALARSEQLAAQNQAIAGETRHLVTARLPALVRQLSHAHVPVPGLLHTSFAGSAVEGDHASILDQTALAVTQERQRVDEAAQAVMRGATSSIQAHCYQMQTAVGALQERVDDPELAQELFALDQLNERNLRRIQATGVLCGAWPGLTRADSHLGDIVLGAQGRMRDFTRIRVTNQLHQLVGVVSRAVEPVAMVVAELMANAVHHSHGTLLVDVSMHQADSGVCVVVDDAGVGMHADEIAFAELMMSREQVMLTQLGDPPRGGFATIGRLARQFGFAVSVDKTAPYGGVRAVVFLPERLLVLMDESTQPMSAMAPLPPRAAPPAEQAPAWLDEGTAQQPVLPQRRRREPSPAATAYAQEAAYAQDTAHVQDLSRVEGAAQDQAAQDQAGQDQSAGHDPGRPGGTTPEESGTIWGAFQRGTESGRAAAADSEHERSR
ncbi:anti-sigma regulatory factor (Ser/Thr protein kinase) [Streptacidiphilus sp. MAP12-16]|uniref:ATP-binding protein n=1 Tax=Streptacidiphilus sp. MAP12-16 TaxID=3156300 RepID=UPI00351661A2